MSNNLGGLVGSTRPNRSGIFLGGLVESTRPNRSCIFFLHFCSFFFLLNTSISSVEFIFLSLKQYFKFIVKKLKQNLINLYIYLNILKIINS